MTFTAPSSRVLPARANSRAIVIVLSLLAVCLGTFAATALAKQSDRTKNVDIEATSADAALGKPNGVSHLKGDVRITQGTLKISSDTATVYFDAHSKVRRVVLKGTPARMQQTDDQGNVLHGRAETIDYQVSKSLATLTGDAWVHQPEHGTAQGHKLVYNTATSAMRAQGQGQQRVHLTFKPRQQIGAVGAGPKTPVKPASASSTQAPPPASAGSAPQPAAMRSTH